MHVKVTVVLNVEKKPGKHACESRSRSIENDEKSLVNMNVKVAVVVNVEKMAWLTCM